MRSNNRGRPRKYGSKYGGITDDTALLALIWEAEGNVAEAGRRLVHEGTKRLYTALDRLKSHVNGNLLETDPSYDFLFRFDRESQQAVWTRKGIELVRQGEEILKLKRALDEKQNKNQRLALHQAECKTPLFEDSKIVLALPERISRFEIFHICRNCGLCTHNILTVEFMRWQAEHPELYSGHNRAFDKVSDPDDGKS